MQKKISLRLAAVLAAGAFLLTSCTAQDQTTAAPSAVPTVTAEETAAPTEAAPDQAAATVNGTPISLSAAKTAYNFLKSYFSYAGTEVEDTEIRKMAMDSAVEQALMDAHAAEWGLTLTDAETEQITAEAKADWEDTVTYYMGVYYNTTASSTEEELKTAREAVLAMLSNSGFTEEQSVQDTLTTAQNERVQAKMAEGVSTTQEDVQAAYDTYVNEDAEKYADDVYDYEMDTVVYGGTSWYTPAGYRYISWILLDVDTDLLADYIDKAAQVEEGVEMTEEGEGSSSTTVTQADVDAAAAAMIASVQDKITEIQQKAANGTPFADLVAEYGHDATWMTAETAPVGQKVSMDSVVWDPAIVKAAFSVNTVGQISEPVVGNAGVFLVCYMGDVPAGGPEMTDTLTAELTDEVQARKESEAAQAMLDTWVSEADISYTDEGTAWLNGND